MILLIYILLGAGIVFQALGTLALLRFPDVYTRMHGTTMCTTFGSIFIYLGVIVYGFLVYFSGRPEYILLPIHTVIAMVMIMITNAVGAHAIARAAHRSGVMPRYAVVDRLKERKK
jgi:multicomponent Na+:H+ antiporter subunit G